MKINKNKIFLFAFSLLISFLPGIIGSLFTVKAIENWYVYLNKPIFNPPNWIFSPVWILLYILIGISFYLILVKKPKIDQQNFNVIIFLFTCHLVLNASWSIFFFNFHDILTAYINILCLDLVIFLCIIKFYKVSKIAGLLFVPYLIWILFATYLNLSIFLLN
ncbi:MAG: TspO/MBR family protein [Patescibacteria group bacterium]